MPDDGGRSPPAHRPATAREGGLVRYAARVEYDGTEFAGFQVQPGGRTVQGELEAALRRLNGGRRIRVEAAGRTDAGVHAKGQVDRIHLPGRIAAARLGRAWRRYCRADVSIGRLRRVVTGFQPRTRRCSGVSVHHLERATSPLRERYALGVREPLDVAAMDEAAQVLVGRHDFSAFGGRHRQPIRTLYRGAGPQEGSHGHGRRGGDAFLRQMVRSIVAALLRIGHGEATTDRSGGRVAVAGPGLRRSRSLRRTGCVSGGSSSAVTRPVRIGKARG